MVEVRGYVEFVEPKAKRGQRVTLRVASMGDLPPEARPYRVRVSTGKMTPGLQAGSAVYLRATLMPLSEPALPGDYDFARQARFERLGALGYSYTAAEPDPSVGPPPWDLRAWAAIERLRAGIAQRVTAVLPRQTGAIAVALITACDQRRLSRLRAAACAVDLRAAHGGDGGRRVLSRAADPGRLSIACTRLSDQEVVGGRGDSRNARLSDDLGRVVRHRPLRHHDRDHVPRSHPRPPGACIAQRRAGGGAHSAAFSRKPVRCRIPDVVCRRRGAYLGLRGVARPWGAHFTSRAGH